MLKRCILGLLLIISAEEGVAATPTSADLQHIEAQLQAEQQTQRETKQKAAEISTEIKSLQQQIIRAAKTVQAKEEQLFDLEKSLQGLQIKQKALEERLALTDTQTVQIVTGLQTLALRPPEILLLKPLSPIEILRSHMMMNHALPVIGSINTSVKKDLEDLTQTKNRIQKQIVQIKTLTTQLSERTQQMNVLLQQKSLLQAQYDATYIQAKKRAEQLAAQANDLKDLLKKLEQERQQKLQEQKKREIQLAQKTSNEKSAFEKSYGSLLYPVRGYVVQNFGDTTVSGSHIKGMTLTTREKAQVITPFDGTVLFAGPFKNYGQMLIIDNGGNYLTLLAGLGKINASIGQELLAGEPIGTMGTGNPRLYIEIRKDGQPVNPKPWFIPRTS